MGNLKKIIIAIVIILILAVVTFFGVNAIISTNKNYKLEEIKEQDYKYFSVYEERKIWSN